MGALVKISSFALTALLAVGSSSCFAVADLDRFQTRQDNGTNFNDLRLTVRGMTSHVNEMFEYRVVDATNTIQSRGIIKPLGGVEASLFVPGAVPKQNGPFNLDFYADHDNSGGYDTDPANQRDHAWRIPLTPDLFDEDKGEFRILFDHNTSFSFLAKPEPPRTYGGNLKMRLVNMGALVGKRIEVRIADASSKRVVALYRIPALADVTTPVDVEVAGMIERGVTYDVVVYTDDRAGTPASIKAFRLQEMSADGGLSVEFDPARAPVVTDVPSP